MKDDSSIRRSKYPQYYKDVSSLHYVDVYRVCDLFGVDDRSGCMQHAIKKLLLSGVRNGSKPSAQDIQEAIDSLKRKLEMLEENKDFCPF